GRRHHSDHGERLGRRRQCRAAPDIPVSVSVDDMLQRLTELAKCAHALFDRFAAEHLGAQLETACMLVFVVHGPFPIAAGDRRCKRRSTYCIRSLALLLVLPCLASASGANKAISARLMAAWRVGEVICAPIKSVT